MCGHVKGVPLDRTGQPVKEPHSVIRNSFTFILRLVNLAIQFWFMVCSYPNSSLCTVPRDESMQFTNMITVCN